MELFPLQLTEKRTSANSTCSHLPLYLEIPCTLTTSPTHPAILPLTHTGKRKMNGYGNGNGKGAATTLPPASASLKAGWSAASIAQLKAARVTTPTASTTPPATQSAVSKIAAQSPLTLARRTYQPRMPHVLHGSFAIREGISTGAKFDAEQVEKLFPALFGQPTVEIVPHFGEKPAEVGRRVRIGVVLSGGPAPGGHNVVSGLLDYCTARNADSLLFGFLGGPSGIVDGEWKVLGEDEVRDYRNMGGFHVVGSGRTKIESEAQFAAVRRTVTEMDLDGLVIVGGDDSNSNAMKLAEDFKRAGLKCCAIGVPKTLDGESCGFLEDLCALVRCGFTDE
jgi:Phosphofructokinase